MATELEPRGIRVHTVLPGFAETEGFPQRDVLPRHAHRFVIEADDVAEAIVNAVERNRREVHVPHYYRLATLAQPRPGLVARIGRGMSARSAARTPFAHGRATWHRVAVNCVHEPVHRRA